MLEKLAARARALKIEPYAIYIAARGRVREQDQIVFPEGEEGEGEEE